MPRAIFSMLCKMHLKSVSDKSVSNIPKVIHYCWFGRNPLPETAVKCIESWKKFLPDYEIMEWNEDNFDVNSCRYTSEAYAARKYAFVSDYARFKILYERGGLYFDTDVEVIRTIDDIITRGPFMGCERSVAASAQSVQNLGVNPGLGLGLPPALRLCANILTYYESVPFLKEDGTPNTLDTVVTITSRILCEQGLQLTDQPQQIAGVWIYPNDYFAPKDIETKNLTITPNTRSIHHYDASWAEWYDRTAGNRGPKLKRIFGNRLGDRINVVIYVFQRYGLFGVIRKILNR